jgi:hypothetical protein
MLFSIAVTLMTLDHFSRSLIAYLSRCEDFPLLQGVDQIPERITFLLHLLTYSDIPNRNSGLNSKSFSTGVIRRDDVRVSMLQHCWQQRSIPMLLCWVAFKTEHCVQKGSFSTTLVRADVGWVPILSRN